MFTPIKHFIVPLAAHLNICYLPQDTVVQVLWECHLLWRGGGLGVISGLYEWVHM